jgi:hypothetical protein
MPFPVAIFAMQISEEVETIVLVNGLTLDFGSCDGAQVSFSQQSCASQTVRSSFQSAMTLLHVVEPSPTSLSQSFAKGQERIPWNPWPLIGFRLASCLSKPSGVRFLHDGKQGCFVCDSANDFSRSNDSMSGLQRRVCAASASVRQMTQLTLKSVCCFAPDGGVTHRPSQIVELLR